MSTGRFSLLIEKGQIQTYMKSSAGYTSQFTCPWLNIPAPCTLLCMQACWGQCDRRALLTASVPAAVLLESFNLGTTSNTTHVGWECHSAFGGEPQEEIFLDVKALLLERWEEPTEIAPDGMLPFLLYIIHPDFPNSTEPARSSQKRESSSQRQHRL